MQKFLCEAGNTGMGIHKQIYVWGISGDPKYIWHKNHKWEEQ